MANPRGRGPRWVLALLVAALIAVVVRQARRRQRTLDDDNPADVGFMRAIHAAFRRDLARLASVAPDVDRLGRGSDGVLAGWAAFRDALSNHHAAEDIDLWPVLRTHLTDAGGRDEVDAMVVEHREIPAALDAVDAALSGGGGVTVAAEALARLVRGHLDHEERSVFPLLEEHLSGGEWRAFLRTERARRSARERPLWLAWVLDEAALTDTDAVLSELPRPARVFYRRVLGPRYRVEHHWRLDMPTTERSITPTGLSLG
jgi:Hemerythrin HHE cation binding domain